MKEYLVVDGFKLIKNASISKENLDKIVKDELDKLIFSPYQHACIRRIKSKKLAMKCFKRLKQYIDDRGGIRVNNEIRKVTNFYFLGVINALSGEIVCTARDKMIVEDENGKEVTI